MNDLVRLEMIAQSYDRFFRTRDIEHLKDVERILEYGRDEFERRYYCTLTKLETICSISFRNGY